METYTVMAWLPGTSNMCAKDRNGEIGWLDAETGEFHVMFPLFYDAATLKYGYHVLTPQVVTAEQAKALLPELQAKHKFPG